MTTQQGIETYRPIFSVSETDVLLNIIDIVVKYKGLEVSENATVLAKKILGSKHIEKVPEVAKAEGNTNETTTAIPEDKNTNTENKNTKIKTKK